MNLRFLLAGVFAISVVYACRQKQGGAVEIIKNHQSQLLPGAIKPDCTPVPAVAPPGTMAMATPTPHHDDHDGHDEHLKLHNEMTPTPKPSATVIPTVKPGQSGGTSGAPMPSMPTPTVLSGGSMNPCR